MPMPQTQRRITLITLTAIVWGLALTRVSVTLRLAAKAPISVSLTTTPDSVWVSIDGEREDDGEYLPTPRQLAVPPGRHKLKIARAGYIAHVVTIEGDSGEVFKMDDVVLEKNPDLLFSSLTVDGPETPVFVDIDAGLVRGETPLTTTDVTLGTEHVLTVYPRGKADLSVKWRCKFTPTGDADGADYEIKLKTKGDQVKAAGCRRKGTGT
jgi:hypothetical protein